MVLLSRDRIVGVQGWAGTGKLEPPSSIPSRWPRPGCAACSSVWARCPSTAMPGASAMAFNTILTLAVAARLAGYRGVNTFAQFAALLSQEQLKAVGAFWSPSKQRYTPPAITTFHNVLAALPPETLDNAIGQWTGQHDSAHAPVAVDGKDLRGASKQTEDGRRMMVAAVEHDTGVVLGQVEVDSKSNEIPAVRELSSGLDLTGRIVTMDAMHAQHETARCLLGRRADYVVSAVKENQETNHRDVAQAGSGLPRTTSSERDLTHHEPSARQIIVPAVIMLSCGVLRQHMILTKVGRSHRKGLHSGRKAACLCYFARGSTNRNTHMDLLPIWCLCRSALTAAIFTIASYCCLGYLSAYALESAIRINPDEGIKSLQFSSFNGNYLLVVGFERVRRYDLIRRRFDLQWSRPRAKNSYSSESDDKFSISSDGTRLVRINYEEREVQVIDFVSGDILEILPWPVDYTTESSLHEIIFVNDDASVIALKAASGKTEVSVDDYSNFFADEYISYDEYNIYLANTSDTYTSWFNLGNADFLARSISGCMWVLGYVGFVTTYDACEHKEKTRLIDDQLSGLSVSGDGSRLMLEQWRKVGKSRKRVLEVLDAEQLTPADEPWVVDDFDLAEFGYNGSSLGELLGIAWIGNRPIVAYAGAPEYAYMIVLDVYERKLLYSGEYSRFFTDVALSHDGSWLAVNREDDHQAAINIYALRNLTDMSSTSQATVPRLVLSHKHSEGINALAISQDGKSVAMAGADGWVSLWDRASGSMFRRILPDGVSYQLDWSQDGNNILAASSFGNSIIVDVSNGEQHILDDDLYGSGEVLATFLRGDSRVLHCGVQDKCTVRGLLDAVHIRERDGNGVIWMKPQRGVAVQLWKDYSRDYNARQLLPEEGTRSPYAYRTGSLSTDESSVALALGEDGVGWMELSLDGRRRIISVPEASVSAIAALDGTRIVAGLSNGVIKLMDAVSGETLRTLRTGEAAIIEIVRLDEGRIAVLSSNPSSLGQNSTDNADRGSILLVSTEELTVLDSLIWHPSVTDEDIRNSAFGNRVLWRRGRLAASRDGRWLVAASELAWWPSNENSLFAQVWDLGTNQSFLLDSPILPAERVEFGRENELLLVDSDTVASLWNSESGRVTQQFRHPVGDTFATLTGDTVIYTPNDGQGAMKAWSVHAGLHDITLPSHELVRGLVAEGSRQGIFLGRSLALLSIYQGWSEARHSDRSFLVDGVHLHAAADRVLWNFTIKGIEVLSASSGESLWRRKDVIPIDESNGSVLMSADHSSVVVIATTGSDRRLTVLETDTGKTRFELVSERYFPSTYLAPVVHDAVVQGILRMGRDRQVERLSLHDGSVIDSGNLGITSLDFAVSNRLGDILLVVEDDDRAVLWDTSSGQHAAFETTAIGSEGVAFSPDGRFLAIAERDGAVSLWDMSSGPFNLHRLARLITFGDGGWAVVADDGRYDASDPGANRALAWVMPDAPTEPLPVSIFLREYYEPGLLPRLLAGEWLPPVSSIAELDREQPRVRISAIEPGDDGQVNVTVNISRAEATGVGDIKLFRDGRVVRLKERVGLPVSSTEWQVVFPNIALPTSGADAVEFSAYAFNADGVKSETHRLSYSLPEVEPKPRRAFVIAVGVNAYENRSWDLRYAADDARANGSIIARHLEASGAFEEVYTVSLIAERDASGAAVGAAARTDLLAVLKVLAGEGGDPARLATIPGAASLDRARPDDLVYLAFSGHGMSGDNGLFHLFLSDIGAGEARVVNDALLTRTLDSDLLASHLLRVDAGDFVMVIDACNSAASVEGGGFKPGPMGSRGLGQLAYDKAMRVLAASQAEAAALESDRLKHGLLTFAMLREGLEGGVADRAPEDRAVSLSEMLDYGVSRVPLLYEDLRDGTFTPQGRGHLDMFSAGEPPPSVQRPSLFDFRRRGRVVRMPVLEAAD